jgi:hypothetical protein
MKRKTKRFNGESESVVKDFASTGPDVEELKKGIFSGAAAPDESNTYAPKTRKFTTVSPDKPKPRPAAPKVKTGSGASGFGLKEKEMEAASSVMKRGQAGSSDSGRNPSLDRLMADREANASREARRRSAMVDKANAGVPERRSNVDVAKERLGMKKGGKTASARADGIAQRGKTRGKMC